jgi:hypothetical protein
MPASGTTSEATRARGSKEVESRTNPQRRVKGAVI